MANSAVVLCYHFLAYTYIFTEAHCFVTEVEVGMALPRMSKDARRTSSTRSIFQWQKRTYMMPDILRKVWAWTCYSLGTLRTIVLIAGWVGISFFSWWTDWRIYNRSWLWLVEKTMKEQSRIEQVNTHTDTSMTHSTALVQEEQWHYKETCSNFQKEITWVDQTDRYSCKHCSLAPRLIHLVQANSTAMKLYSIYKLASVLRLRKFSWPEIFLTVKLIHKC